MCKKKNILSIADRWLLFHSNLVKENFIEEASFVTCVNVILKVINETLNLHYGSVCSLTQIFWRF